MDFKREDEIEDENTDILIINKKGGGINIRNNVDIGFESDEGNEEDTGINDEIGSELEVEHANEEII